VKRRHHVDESALQKAVKLAVRNAGIEKPASCHTLRHHVLFRIISRIVVKATFIGPLTPFGLDIVLTFLALSETGKAKVTAVCRFRLKSYLNAARGLTNASATPVRRPNASGHNDDGTPPACLAFRERHPDYVACGRIQKSTNGQFSGRQSTSRRDTRHSPEQDIVPAMSLT
jgi:hypothetical protein